MKKTLFVAFYACLLLLALLIGVMIGRNARDDYALLCTHPEAPVTTNRIPNENIGKIDINKATIDELVSLPGVGEVLAERIVLYRIDNGPYQTIYDLLKVEGIGEKKFSEILDYIYTGG